MLDLIAKNFKWINEWIRLQFSSGLCYKSQCFDIVEALVGKCQVSTKYGYLWLKLTLPGYDFIVTGKLFSISFLLCKYCNIIQHNIESVATIGFSSNLASLFPGLTLTQCNYHEWPSRWRAQPPATSRCPPVPCTPCLPEPAELTECFSRLFVINYPGIAG